MAGGLHHPLTAKAMFLNVLSSLYSLILKQKIKLKWINVGHFIFILEYSAF